MSDCCKLQRAVSQPHELSLSGTLIHDFNVQVKPVYTYVHSQHHQIGSAITALGTAFGDAMDIGLCFVAFHLVLGVYLYYQPAWNIAAVVLLIVFEVRSFYLQGCRTDAPWATSGIVTVAPPRWNSNLVQCSFLSALLLASPSQLPEGVQQLIVQR